MSVFIARGVVGTDRGRMARVDRFTYVSEVSADWYQWNGAHRATHFVSPGAALAAAALCKGPWFNHPDPGTVEAISL